MAHPKMDWQPHILAYCAMTQATCLDTLMKKAGLVKALLAKDSGSALKYLAEFKTEEFEFLQPGKPTFLPPPELAEVQFQLGLVYWQWAANSPESLSRRESAIYYLSLANLSQHAAAQQVFPEYLYLHGMQEFAMKGEERGKSFLVGAAALGHPGAIQYLDPALSTQVWKQSLREKGLASGVALGHLNHAREYPRQVRRARELNRVGFNVLQKLKAQPNENRKVYLRTYLPELENGLARLVEAAGIEWEFRRDPVYAKNLDQKASIFASAAQEIYLDVSAPYFNLTRARELLTTAVFLGRTDFRELLTKIKKAERQSLGNRSTINQPSAE